MIEVINIGTQLEPRTRLVVDGVIVANGTPRELEPLRLELEDSPLKATAIREAFSQNRHTGTYKEIDPLHYTVERV